MPRCTIDKSKVLNYLQSAVSTRCPSLNCTIPQNNFMCRSVEYNYVTLQCRLSDYDRRTPVDDFKPIELVDAQGEEPRLSIVVSWPAVTFIMCRD